MKKNNVEITGLWDMTHIDKFKDIAVLDIPNANSAATQRDKFDFASTVCSQFPTSSHCIANGMYTRIHSPHSSARSVVRNMTLPNSPRPSGGSTFMANVTTH